MRALVILPLAVALSGCGSHRLEIPSGPGEPFAEHGRAFAAATESCRGVRALTAEAGVSGSVGGGKVRGRVILGYAEPGKLRLEAVAPMGAPAFILAASGGAATLLFPRSREVLDDEPVERVLEALIGVPLGPDDLGAILAGCGLADPEPVAGRRFAEGWARVDVGGGSTVFLREESGTWRVRAVQRPGVFVEYEGDRGEHGTPRVVRLRSAGEGRPEASLRLALFQVETNAPIDPKAFTVALPSGAIPISLSDLKAAGPLGGR